MERRDIHDGYGHPQVVTHNRTHRHCAEVPSWPHRHRHGHTRASAPSGGGEQDFTAGSGR